MRPSCADAGEILIRSAADAPPSHLDIHRRRLFIEAVAARDIVLKLRGNHTAIHVERNFHGAFRT